jgi:two-component system sensor histidine kinase UhpB
MSLRFSINLVITLVMIMFILSLAALQIDASRRSIDAEMLAATRITVQLLTNLINYEQAQSVEVSPQVLVEFLEHSGRIRAHDIRVENLVGATLYASPSSPYKSGRSAPQWFANIVAPPVTASTLDVGSGSVSIVPDASRAVLDAWDELLNLFWLSLALFTLVNLIVFWFAGRALKQNRELTQLIQRHIEDERRNLALELHDELGQSVTAVKTIATTLVNRTRDKYPELQGPAQLIVDVSAQMYDSMHGMVRRLRPLVLDQLGLHTALQELLDSQQARHPAVRFTLLITGSLEKVNADTGIAAYRMVQECLTNIVRHANATDASVNVEAGANLTITVHDNGNGLLANTGDRIERFGLIGMRERAEGLGGTFHWQDDKGVRVVVSLPLRVVVTQIVNPSESI